MDIRSAKPKRRVKRDWKRGVVQLAYFQEADRPLYEAMARKYPSKRGEGIPNVTAFIRAHADELLGD